MLYYYKYEECNEKVLYAKRQLFDLEKFVNELDAIEHVFNMPHSSNAVDLAWLEELELHIKPANNDWARIRRINGDEEMEQCESREAAFCYTEAIMNGNPNDEELALAHAGRAAALFDLCYFAQAYDDCVCALTNDGIRQDLQHKMPFLLRKCAVLMGNSQEIPDEIAVKLRAQLSAMKENKNDVDIVESTSPLTRIDPSQFGRCLAATENIKKGTVLLQEKAYAAVPNRSYHCAHCLTTLFVSFPCMHCNIVYCSLKCRETDSKFHQFECAGHKIDLLCKIQYGHLALRTALRGTTEIVNLFQEEKDAKTIWRKLEKQHTLENKAYKSVWELDTNFEKKTLDDIKDLALKAYTFSLYLGKFTNFFQQNFKDSKADVREWQKVMAALIMRHLGQISINATEIYTMYSALPIFADIWQGPHLLKKRQLHLFRNITVCGMGIFPRLSIANHACKPDFEMFFNGPQLKSYAIKDIKKHEEIFNCYIKDHLNSTKAERRRQLAKYNFECLCKICSEPNADFEVEKRNQLRCEVCELITIGYPLEDSQCPHCGEIQTFEWMTEYNDLIEQLHRRNTKHISYKILDDLDYWLPDDNEYKAKILFELLPAFFHSPTACNFLSEDYDVAVRLAKELLAYVVRKKGPNNLEYVSRMTYVWDLIALNKMALKAEEIQNMLQVCDLVLDDNLKMVFRKYYENFIQDKLSTV